jgi:hypothetical protein
MTFRIYSDPIADALLWEEDHLDVIVVGGVFSVMLGGEIAITPDLLEGPAFLGVEINGNEELEPRQELVSTAFSLRCVEALNAAKLGGVEAEGYVTNAAADATELALQSQITSLEAKLTALEELVAQGGSSGGGDNPPLVNGVHTATECQDAGGIVTEITGPDLLCRFAAPTCPADWAKLGNWSTTQTAVCTGSVGGFASACGAAGTCSALGHPFLDEPPATCCAGNVCGVMTEDPQSGPSYACKPYNFCGGLSPSNCCTSTTLEVGCF